MKIAQLMMRGIEGCGVTRFTIELNEWLNKNGHEALIYTSNDKKWPRQKYINMPEYKLVDKYSEETFINVLNNYDYIFIHSVPSKSHSEMFQNNFLNVIKKINVKKLIFQNDHNNQSLARNANFMEICKYCDKIASFGTETIFFNKIKELLGEKEALSRYIHLHNSFDINKLIKFRKNNHLNKITYLGRFATFKDPKRLLELLNTRHIHGHSIEAIGIERSIGSLCSFFRINPKLEQLNPDIIFFNKLDEMINADKDLNKLNVCGPYNWEEGIEELSNSMFGVSFYNLKPEMYGDNIEYAQVEMIGVGCIPIFDYHFGEHVHAYENGYKTNKRLIDIPYFALFLKKDLSNLEEIAHQIKEISNNIELQKNYRKCSFDVISKHINIDAVNNRLINDIMKE